ncbi:tetratricopeptide repeat protein [Hydrogenimonas sp.]
MSRYLPALIATLFLFFGCAQKRETVTPQTSSMHKEAGEHKNIVSFQGEYDYIIQALYFREHGEFAKSYTLFHALYKKTHNVEYEIEALKLLIGMHHFKKARESLTSLVKRYPKNPELYRLLAIASLKLGKTEEALESAKKALALKPDNILNVDLAASIYLLQGTKEAYEKAYAIYERYYKRHYDDDSVVKMASILLYKLKDADRATRLLEMHSKMRECSQKVCLFLAEIYRSQNDLDHLAGIYERLYDVTRQSEYAQKAAEIYAYQKRYGKAVKLLEASDADARLLLAIYKQTRQFEKAAALAKKLYEETDDPVWLAEYGILLYEEAPKKDDPKLLSRVVKILTEAMKEGVDDPLYYNYLGYLLIDHDIDVKLGIQLVQKALKAEPDSPFYIDSLAWGHYKLKECKKAYAEMKKVVEKMGLEDKEIKKHWNEIQKCRSERK